MLARGVTSSEKERQRCRASVRGCMRTSITLSRTAGSYLKRVMCRTEYAIFLPLQNYDASSVSIG